MSDAQTNFKEFEFCFLSSKSGYPLRRSLRRLKPNNFLFNRFHTYKS